MKQAILFGSVVLAFLALNSGLTPRAHAAITVLDFWRMGENDPGLVQQGAASATTRDSVGDKHLTLSGSGIYWTDVASAAAVHVGSRFSFDFLGGAIYETNAALVSTVTDNFGIEAWANPDTLSGNHYIAYNGNINSNGWGLVQIGNTYRGLFGGVGFFGSGPATLNGWTHVALVRSSGTATLYINGVASGTTNATPNMPAGYFGVAAPPQAPAQERWSGNLDELRVFTFAPGQFSTNDLLLNVPFTAPEILSHNVTGITDSSAIITATVHPHGLMTPVQFHYGTTTNYGSLAISNAPALTASISISVLVQNLSLNTLYHCREIVTNSAGTNMSADFTFTTVAFAPTATTQPATSLTSTGATLNATINPGGTATTAWFEWGIGSVYGQQTAPTSVGAGVSSVAFSNQLTGLTAGLAYHYRVVASNSIGVVRGQDVRFWSPALTLNGANPMTNNLNTTFTDPGAIVTASPQAIAAGGFHNLILQPDGRVLSGGRNNKGQINVPSNATNVLAIAGGEAFSLAVSASRTPLGWGENADGQRTFPAGATNLSAMAGGQYFSIGLRTNGTVLAWGYTGNGQTTVPSAATNVVAIAAGESHGLALRANGTVIGWGNNSSGQTNVPGSATNIVAVAAGEKHSLALRADGTVVGWGDNTSGQTNVPSSATNIVAIAAGRDFSTALRSNGTILAWGANNNGQTNAPPDATNIVAIANGVWHVLALRADGLALTWGINLEGTLGLPADYNNLNLPVTVSGSVNTSVPGTYLLTYSTTNSLGVAVSTTRTVVVPSSTSPIATTQPATAVTNTSATLNATINPNSAATTYYFQYGLTAAYGSFSSTNSLPATNSLISTNRTITGLAPGTLYHFRVVASNPGGTTNGGDLTFTTPGPPIVTTQPATAVTNTAALLNATLIPNGVATTYYFQYGLTAAYGSNSPAQVVPDSGLNFNGVNQSASRIGSLNGLVLGNSPHTIEAWLKPTLTHTNREWVVLLSNTSPGAHHWLRNADGSTQIGSYGGAQVYPQLNSNVWTHLAASFDGTNLRVYTNGVLAGTVAASFNLQIATLTLAQGFFSDSYYGGGMDDLRIWNTARTASQIQTNLNRAFAGNETGLLAYYRMDEGTGTVLSDASGQTNNLQTANSPTWTTGASGIQSLIQTSISGLAPGTLYHFRIAASNGVGTVFGGDLTFTTTAPQASASLMLTGPTLLGNGSFQFDFTNTPGASFSVLASTNVALPLTNWTVLSNVVESPAGQFRFTDPQATNGGQRFYRVRSP